MSSGRRGFGASPSTLRLYRKEEEIESAPLAPVTMAMRPDWSGMSSGFEPYSSLRPWLNAHLIASKRLLARDRICVRSAVAIRSPWRGIDEISTIFSRRRVAFDLTVPTLLTDAGVIGPRCLRSCRFRAGHNRTHRSQGQRRNSPAQMPRRAHRDLHRAHRS